MKGNRYDDGTEPAEDPGAAEQIAAEKAAREKSLGYVHQPYKESDGEVMDEARNPERAARREAARRRRILENAWAKMKKMPMTIELQWEAPPVGDGTEACVVMSCGSFIDENVIDGYVPVIDKDPRRRRAKEFVEVAEKWAMWKWHTTRGTPVDERDVYQLEPGYESPELKWTTPAPVKSKTKEGVNA